MEQFRQWVKQGKIDTLIMAGIDMQGRLYGKRCAADVVFNSDDGAIHTCDCNFGWDIERALIPGLACTGWHTGYGDLAAIPDWSTLRMYPLFPNTALVLCDTCLPDRMLAPFAPMSILRRQVEKARDLRFRIHAASELEFFLFKESPESARAKDFANLQTASGYIGDYCILRSSLDEWLLGEVRRLLPQAGVDIECSKSEWGLGQHEINIVHAEVMESAARHVVLKQAVRELAAMKGAQVTFMAKWHAAHSSNGCHVHMSLWRGDKPAFPAGGAHGSGPDAMSKTMRHFLGGMMALARDLQLFYAPNINSYKRYGDLTFAPTTLTWGGDNRTVAFRCCGHGKALRLENRVPGADANPYLAYAAMLASGLYGIENEIEPEGPFVTGNAYDVAGAPKLHRNLMSAAEAFAASKLARQLLGDDVVDHYAAVARWELQEFFGAVTDWERRRYFEQG